MMKKFFIGLIAVSLTVIFGQAVSAQTVSNDAAAKTSVKSLKKTLSKNSRFGSEVVYWFKAMEFEGCQVSFRFSRLNESGADRFANLSFDRNSGVYRNDTVRMNDLPVYVSPVNPQGESRQSVNTGLGTVNGQTSTFQNNNFRYYSSGLNSRAFTTESFVTFLDLSIINADSIKIKENENGQYFIVFDSLKDKTAIGKMFVGGNEMMKLDSDFIPVSNEKSGNKSGEKFVEAVKACQQ
ncbi:MAG TPA: hypothetical protein PKE69_23320 [Pyrinomonadaceae bacterium]|nr:hypothetical protein [Pyrinomonadaceae bacterium]